MPTDERTCQLCGARIVRRVIEGGKARITQVDLTGGNAGQRMFRSVELNDELPLACQQNPQCGARLASLED